MYVVYHVKLQYRDTIPRHNTAKTAATEKCTLTNGTIAELCGQPWSSMARYDGTSGADDQAAWMTKRRG